MEWMEVATSFRWLEDCYPSPLLGWNPTGGHGSPEAGNQGPFRTGMCRGQGSCLCPEDLAEERHLKRPCHCSLEMTVNLEKDKFLPVGI